MISSSDESVNDVVKPPHILNFRNISIQKLVSQDGIEIDLFLSKSIELDSIKYILYNILHTLESG